MPPHCRRLLFAFTLLAAGVAIPIPGSQAEVSGSLAIAGNGPELAVIERLARTFEKINPRVYIDLLWDEKSRPIELVKSGQAQIAVTGGNQPDLAATQIAWDGIAIMVNLSNHTKEVSMQQVADIFSGKIKFWSELGGPETRILVIDRPRNRNLREYLEKELGIDGKIPDTARIIGPDDKAIKAVAGTVPPISAVSYISLQPALEAVTSGVAVRLLPIDKVEPEEPPVKDGRYKLRRPILLLSTKESNPLVEAFKAYALSKEGQKIVDEYYTPVDSKS
jgi:phosphate transport system substrate-binding protein